MSEMQSPKPPENLVPLDRWVIALSRARKSQRLREILDAPDAPQRIANAPVPELFYAILEVGLPDAHHALEYVTPEQFQGLIDLAAWRKDHFDIDSCSEWLQALASTSFFKLQEVITRVDEEWLVLFLRQYIAVYEASDELPEMPESVTLVASPDQQFFLAVADPQENGALAMKIIEALYAKDVLLGWRILEACRAEFDILLEEDARRFRQGRLEEMGFFTWEEAMQLYIPLPPKKLAALLEKPLAPVPFVTPDLAKITGLPAPYLPPLERKGPLAEVLSNPGAEDLAKRVLLELPPLINRVLSAQQIDPSEESEITEAVLHVRGVLDIAISRLGGGNLERAREKMRALSLVEMFRIGWSQIAPLAPRAHALRESPLLPLLEDDTREALRALDQQLPQFSLALLSPPGEGMRPFQGEDDLGRALRELERAEVSLDIARLIGLTTERQEELYDVHTGAAAVSLPVCFGTAVANALLGRPFDPEPLSISDLPALKEKLFSQGEISPEVVKTVRETLQSLPEERKPRAEEVVRSWLSMLVEELEPLSTEPLPEARFVGGILLR